MALRQSTGMRNKMGGEKINLFLTPTFESDTDDWTEVDSVLSIVSGGQSGNALEVEEIGGVNPGKAYQDVNTRPGRDYRLKFWFKKGTSDTGSVTVGTTADDDNILISLPYSDTDWDQKVILFRATDTVTRIVFRTDDPTIGETSLFDEVSVEEIFDGFTDLFKNCKIHIFTGGQPASADAAATGTLLYTLTVNGDGVTGLTWANDVTNGIVSKNPSENWQAIAIEAGTAGYARIVEDGGNPLIESFTEARFDGAIATSGAEYTLASTSVVQGAIQSCASFFFNFNSN